MKSGSKSRSPWDGDDDDDDGDDEYEHGDVISHAKDEDASDYSMHQFLASDDGRGVAGADEDTVDQNADDDGAQDEVDKSVAEAEDNDFDSEDTPEDDSFVSLKTKTSNSEETKQKLEIRALNMMKSKQTSRSPWDEDDEDDDGDDEYEHGDVISHAKDEDASATRCTNSWPRMMVAVLPVRTRTPWMRTPTTTAPRTRWTNPQPRLRTTTSTARIRPTMMIPSFKCKRSPSP